jgi:hypothetical protein
MDGSAAESGNGGSGCRTLNGILRRQTLSDLVYGASAMLNAAMLLADEMGQRLSSAFVRSFGGENQRVTAAVNEAARLVMPGLIVSEVGETIEAAILRTCGAGGLPPRPPQAGPYLIIVPVRPTPTDHSGPSRADVARFGLQL